MAYENGADFHTVVVECECEVNQIVVADEKGEDCNAYEKKNELQGTCERCNKKLAINIVKQ